MIRGVLAAAVTPLRDEGRELAADAFGPLVDFYAAAGLDGVLALGTTGEGILLSASERRHAAALFVEASGGRLQVAVHCGAQTTAETAALAAHAAEHGADAVAVIAPPYYPLDEEEIYRHFAEAANACAPLAFYVYEFAARSGYAIPPRVIERLRESARNLVGLKVSDAPLERFEPYLIEGLDVFVGPEALIHAAYQRGAVGTVSGLGGAFPELVAAVARNPTQDGATMLGAVRSLVQRFPFQAALKATLQQRGLPIATVVRGPLRELTHAERDELERELAACDFAYASSQDAGSP